MSQNQNKTTNSKSKKRHMEEFTFFDESHKRNNQQPVHPYEEYEDFCENPPIPEFNYIIDNKTLKIIEDKTGQP